jgi:hypothetical protein
MSLADVLAVSQAAKTVVLIGGTDVSALDHILAGEQTIPPDEWEDPKHRLSFARNSEDLLAQLGHGVSRRSRLS